jgi:uncharacterized protein YaiI (UPF0178 family)
LNDLLSKSGAMQIWVDADACPNVIKDILFRTADRLQINVTLVANKLLRVPPSRFIKALQVPGGMDVADRKIIELMQEGDLVITADLPLAADVLKGRGFALNPRGMYYTEENIAQQLSMRNFMESLRESGVDTGGPDVFSAADRQSFANQLDKHLSRRR